MSQPFWQDVDDKAAGSAALFNARAGQQDANLAWSSPAQVRYE